MVSAMVSLTLVPMLASRLLRHTPREGGVAEDHEETHPEPGTAIGRAFERGYRWVHGSYMRTLDWTLHHRMLMLMLAAATFALTAWLFITIPKGFFPEEDIGQIQITTEAAEDISFPAMKALQDRVADALMADPSVAYVNSFIGVGGPTATQNAGRLFAVLKPRGERPRDAAGAGVAAQALPRDPGRRRLHAAGAEPAPGRPRRARRASSTRCRA